MAGIGCQDPLLHGCNGISPYYAVPIYTNTHMRNGNSNSRRERGREREREGIIKPTIDGEGENKSLRPAEEEEELFQAGCFADKASSQVPDAIQVCFKALALNHQPPSLLQGPPPCSVLRCCWFNNDTREITELSPYPVLQASISTNGSLVENGSLEWGI